MGGRDNHNIRMQLKRIKKFPKDRIAFLPFNENAATLDKATFEKYRNGETSLKIARQTIAYNNYLPEVTEEQFLKAFIDLGYGNE